MYTRFIGQIALFPYNFVPAGWSICDGSTLPISESIDLFQILGTTFGGDGEMTFALPNFKADAPQGCNYYIALSGIVGGRYDGVILSETLVSVIPDQPDYVKVKNLVECAGQAFSSNQALQTCLGTNKLPDLKGKAPAKSRYVMAVDGTYPGGEKQGVYAGEIILLPSTPSLYLGDKFRLCNGDVLKTQENTALASLLGAGSKPTFALPKLTAPLNSLSYYISLGGIFPPRS